MKVRWLFALIVLSPVLLLWGCGQDDLSNAPPSLNTVATFNGGLITKEQLKARFDSLMPCCKGRYQGEEGARAMIKDMVLPAVIAQTIKQKKIDFRGNIREELGNLTDELNMSFLHMKFHEQILNANEKYKDLKENYEYQKRILKGYPISERFNGLVELHKKIHHMIAKEVEKVAEDYIRKLRAEAAITKNYHLLRVKVTDEELKEFYHKHKEGLHGDEYHVPERMRVQEIIIKAAKDNEEEDCPTCDTESGIKAKERAESALTELRSGADFRTVAEKYSSNTNEPIISRWIVRGNNGAKFEEAIFSLEIEEISPVLKKEDSFHIIKVLERQAGRFKTYEEIKDQIEREYRWQKGEDYLKENRDRILFTINARPYTIEDFMEEYKRSTPPHQCHHMKKAERDLQKEASAKLCDLAHNDIEDQEKLLDRMIDRELIVEDTYNQMIHVEHQKEIEFLTMASLYPVFHREEMEKLIHITDEMVEDYYKNHQQDYHYPAKAKISMIVTKGGENKEKKNRALEKARSAYRELKPSFFSFKRGRDFAEIARKYSEESSLEELRFSDKALEILRDYAWPGNVRELENVIQRLVVTTDSDFIDAPDLPELMRYSALRETGVQRTLAAVEAAHIRTVLASVDGNKTKAAEILGIDRKTLREKLKKLVAEPH